MSVTLPNTSATISSEYAANNITFNRSMVPDANGHIVSSFNASIQYSRADYVVDGSGNKLNVVQRNTPNQPNQPVNGPDVYSGYIVLQGADLAALESEVATVDLLDAIATAADALIHADLVKRAIMAS